MKTIIPSDKDMLWIKAEVISLGYQIQRDSGGYNPDPDDTVRAWQELRHDEGQDYELTDDQIAILANAIEFEFPPPDKASDGDIGTDQYDQMAYGYDQFLDREDWKQLERQERRNHEKE